MTVKQQAVETTLKAFEAAAANMILEVRQVVRGGKRVQAAIEAKAALVATVAPLQAAWQEMVE